MKDLKNKLENSKIDTRIKLAGLWATLMLLYIYCDIYSFYRPGYLAEIMSGKIGAFDVGQGVLAGLSLLMVFPALMIPACLFIRPSISKWLNIIVGAIYTLVNIGNLVGEIWAYYWIYGILEIILTVAIILVSVKWIREKNL